MNKSHKYLILIYWILALFLYAGFLFHRSPSPSIFIYSSKYFLFLVVALAFLCLLPALLRLYVKKVGWRGLFFSLVPLCALLFLAYFISSFAYYHSRSQRIHPFDPYLQIGNTRFTVPPKKQDGVFRILCLGGSTTEGLRGQSYPAQLKPIIQKLYPNLRIEVLNGGKAWYTSKHSLINYVTYCRQWKPDLVIVMHALNDLYRSFSPPDYAIGSYDKCWAHFYGPAFRGAKSETFEEYLYSKFLGERTKIWFSELRFKDGDYQSRQIDYPLTQYPSIKMFNRHLRALTKYIKKDGAIVMLVSEPSLYKDVMDEKEQSILWIGKTFCWSLVHHRREYPSYRSLGRAMEAFNRVVKKVAALEKAIFVDGAASLPKDIKYFEDDAHYSESGYHLFAQIIADEIVKSNIIKSRAKR